MHCKQLMEKINWVFQNVCLVCVFNIIIDFDANSEVKGLQLLNRGFTI